VDRNCEVKFVSVPEEHAYGFPGDHPFKKERVIITESELRALHAPVKWIKVGHPAEESIIRTFHTHDYIDFVRSMSERGFGLLDAGDTPAFPGCYEASSYVVQASLDAIEAAEQGGHAINLNGGLHHAMPNRASGFCIFNDVAIAIRMLLNRGYRRLAYLDIDAHHGDGVMYAFYDNRRVLDIDFHEDGRYLFPGTGRTEETGNGTGKGFKMNLVLPPGSSDPVYKEGFEKVVRPALFHYRPEFILLQAGVDAHEMDPLTHLRLSDEGYVWIYRNVHKMAHILGSKLVVFGGGGYHVPSVVKAWVALVYILANLDMPGGVEHLAAYAKLEDKPLKDSQSYPHDFDALLRKLHEDGMVF
jgi:acetoin utilization protein AcuC